MNSQDFEQFAELWSEVHGIMPGGKQFSRRGMTMIFDALSEYPLNVIEVAVSRHLKTGKFAPTPQDVIEIISGEIPKHVAADEAWAIVRNSFDESKTCIMTPEMLSAKAEVQILMDSEDEVGARMAFRAAYDRLVKSSNSRPVWQISPGSDGKQRFEVITSAISKGLLPKGSGKHYLTHDHDDCGPIAGLLTGKVVDMPKDNEKLKAHWHDIKIAVDAKLKKADEAIQREISEREQKRLEFEAKREAELKRVAEMIENFDKAIAS